MCKKLLLFVLFLSLVAAANASLFDPHQYVDPQPYVDPTNVTATASSTVVWGTHYSPAYTADESGLASDNEDVPPHSVLYHQNDDYMFWLGKYGEASSSYHANTASGPAWIAYDLSGVENLVDMKVFNYNERDYVNNGMRKVTVECSANGSDWTMVGGTFMEFPVSPGRGSDWYEGFTVNLGGVSAQYVVITACATDGNWGGTDGYGLSEIRFHTPEPATIALLGLGALALLRRRRA